MGGATTPQPLTLRLIRNAASLTAASPTLLFSDWKNAARLKAIPGMTPNFGFFLGQPFFRFVFKIKIPLFVHSLIRVFADFLIIS
jgi:hypothetical protein